MFEKELNEFIKKSKESLEKVEKNVESYRESMNQDISGFWGNLKNEFGQINTKLSDAGQKLSDAGQQLSDTSQKLQLQGTLGLMEARDQLERIKGTSEEFIKKVTTNTTQDLDIAKLHAHLAQMDAADLWKEKESQMTSLYNESKVEFEKLAKKAGKEINDILLKLTDIR
ncbi:hypothetical protein PGH07_06850 [Sulfurovum sp. zt1-1]|uniref:Uncharacterized protein n=1 Tax=Sulfurovum zhangzhouensis TaxID=3019067 RepID=A0ABT7QYP3_9BACT|nr:hypothetical protein [Sulfurovum zhangzhouensis]MDM5271891.1 hypothetical protein [Sulfurovum zhangzhouensis]